MPIPYRLNPMGKNEKKYFELVVKPGILTTGMSYGFTPYWNSGGYCSVDWGDGSKQNAMNSGTKLNHTYSVAGTYTIKVKAECYRVDFAGWDSHPIVDSCSGDWEKLGNLTSGYLMFYNCTNMQIDCTSLPDSLTNGSHMFYNCKNAALSLISLPEGLRNGEFMFHGCTNAKFNFDALPESLTNTYAMFTYCEGVTINSTKLPANISEGQSMFRYCKRLHLTLTELPPKIKNGTTMFQWSSVEINLDTLAANAPAEGWKNLTDITSMFHGCPNVTGSRSAFLAKCPNVTGTAGAFDGTNTTE